jgi:hypothetical protein
VDRRKLLLGVLYWLAVLVVSVAILVGLILLLESRDSSSIDSGSWIAALSPAWRF